MTVCGTPVLLDMTVMPDHCAAAVNSGCMIASSAGGPGGGVAHGRRVTSLNIPLEGACWAWTSIPLRWRMPRHGGGGVR